jgi:FixJ family two-component response regulator
MMDRAATEAVAFSPRRDHAGESGVTVRQPGSTTSVAHATMSRSIRPGILMGSQDYIVYVIDDDAVVREALRELFASLDVTSVTFGSVHEYIDYPKRDLPACLILDLELPDVNGLDFQRQLGSAYHPPIVFISGHGDIPSSVRAIKAGAVDFLVKPFSQQGLMTAIDAAIDRDRQARVERAEGERLQQRYASLTPREREVLPLVVSGLLNKQSAAQLGISAVTLQLHRSRIMQKMGAESFADLVRIGGQLNIALQRRQQ